MFSFFDSNAVQSDSTAGERGMADEAMSVNWSFVKFGLRELRKNSNKVKI